MNTPTPSDITDSAPAPATGLWERWTQWSARVGLSRKLGTFLAFCAVLSGSVTYLAISGTASLAPEPGTVLILLNVNLAILLLLGGVIAGKLVQIWSARRRGSAGSKLHVRFVIYFCMVAAVPTLLVAMFSVLFLNLGLQGWFSDRIRTAVSESLNVAEAYLEEHQQAIQADILAMAKDINRHGAGLIGNPGFFNRLVTAQAGVRSLPEAIVVDGTGRVIARSGYNLLLTAPEIPISPEVFDGARQGSVVLDASNDDDMFRALVRLDGLLDSFLYVGRFVDPLVVDRIERARQASAAYQRLEGERFRIEITFAVIFALVAVLMLMAAVMMALMVASRMAAPIAALIAGAEHIRAGDLTYRVEESPHEDELAALTRSFNRMTSQLDQQRSELIEANRQLDDRRRFTETVLEGVSAGVIGLDRKGQIYLPNKRASQLLSRNLDNMVAQPLGEAIPEMAPLWEEAQHNFAARTLPATELSLKGPDGSIRTLVVKITADYSSGASQQISGFVVTFDDITELQAAQRTAAWADVARRIAHEIKNPLTPIQLSAERLRRKYARQINEEVETFENCTDTIVRQVDDIRRMVDEFSSFARMPEPNMARHDLNQICRDAVFLQTQALPSIQFDMDLLDGAAPVIGDDQHLNQVLTNLLKNASEGIEEKRFKLGKSDPFDARITLSLHRVADETGKNYRIRIADNGIGFPAEDRDRLTDPYVTNRSKGTGLGLAIVKKIMEDHHGRLILTDSEMGGALVELTLAIPQESGGA